jgi:hypothetical protein
MTTALLNENVMASNEPALVPSSPRRGPKAARTSSAESAGSTDPLLRKARRPHDLGEEVSLRSPDQRLPSPRRPVPSPPASQLEEFVNVKRLCAEVLRGHRRMSKRVDDFTRSSMEAAEASEEGLLWVLQSELARRDDAAASALSEWQESTSKRVEESLNQGWKDVVAKLEEREGTMLRRLSLLERQVQGYEMFRSFEVAPPPTVHVPRRSKGKDLLEPLTSSSSSLPSVAATVSTAPSFSDTESRTASASTSTAVAASERDGESLDESWALWEAPPPLRRFGAADRRGRWDGHPGIFRSALDDDGCQGWSGWLDFEDDDRDEARSLLSVDDDEDIVGDFRVLPLDFRSHANRPSLRREHHACHGRSTSISRNVRQQQQQQQQGRHGPTSDHPEQQRPPNSCLLWPPLPLALHWRLFGAGRGRTGPRRKLR